VAALTTNAAILIPANSSKMLSAILVTKTVVHPHVDLLPMALSVVLARECVILKKHAAGPPLLVQLTPPLLMEPLVAILVHSLAPLGNAPPVIFNARHSWVLTRKAMTPMPVPQTDVRYPVLLPNLVPMYVIPCNRTSSTEHLVKVAAGAVTVNVKGQVSAKK